MAGPGLVVKLNERRCIGCGLCEENAPDVFRMGALVAHVLSESVQSELQDAVSTAVRDCPVNAISLIPESGRFPDDHHQETKDEEYGGEIREYQRKQRNSTNDDHVETNDTESLERTEHDFAVVSHDPDNNQHPGSIPGA